ncbi:PAS domain S-box protein [Paenibacillus xerothermodurans]|uniref:PAS domain S-box protein n=1 Tax=Paenibacillus xerothermodurans TaxID=1977292 RepID=A0A2W1NXB9_PAEXE|nr:PAS domain S-box protein [Paenibacillus xerothermodurans]PZE22366.1 PAS domain S-box protein [Paenibacillus xerothermodurans]
MYTLDSRFTDAAEGMYYTYEEDNQTKFLEINNAFVHLSGIPKSELLAADPDTLFAPESLKKLPQKKKRLNQKGYVYSEDHLIGRNGVKLNVEIHSSKLRWGQRDIYFHVVKDISEKKWIASQVRNKLILASGILDQQMKISSIYNHYAPLPFIEPEEGMQGLSLFSFIDKTDLLKVRRCFAKSMEYRQEKQVTFLTNESYAYGAIKMKATVKPLVNGSNDVTKVAFVLCRADNAEDLAEEFSPLMLACL